MFGQENCMTYINDDCYYIVRKNPYHYEDDTLSFDYYPAISFDVSADKKTILASMVAVIHPNAMQKEVRFHEVLYPEGVENVPGFEPDVFMTLSSHAPSIVVKADFLLNRSHPWEDIPGFMELKNEYEQFWPIVIQDSLLSVMGLPVNCIGTINHDVARYLLMGLPY